MAAVIRDGSALEYASDELKADKEVVMAAVQTNHQRNDKGEITAANHSLNFASQDLKNDPDIIAASKLAK